MSLGGGSGGSSNQVQKQEVVQSTLPEYARPYFDTLMQRAGSTLTQEYQPYEQERIAGFTPQQQALQQSIMGLKTPEQFGQASALVGQAASGLAAASKYDPSAFTYDKVTAPGVKYYQMAEPGQFGLAQAQQYMSPYMRAVLDVQKREAATDAKKAQLAEDLGAARQGSYGGSRQLIASLERERQLGQQLGDIEAKGMQSAYESAQAQYERDRAAMMAAQRANLEANLGAQQLGVTSGLQALLANQQAALEAAQMSEQSRQFGADLGVRGAAQIGQLGQTMGNLGMMQSQMDLARLGLQSSTAAQQQALNQQYMDMAYQDFLRQRDYPMEQLQQYSGLLRGVPVQPASTTTTYAPSPSVSSQILGTGLGALGMYKSLTG